jgi:citrate synthase
LDKQTKLSPQPDSMKKKTLRSDLGWSTVDRIVVRGKDLPGEILGHLNLGDMAFLELTGRVPDARESKVFNAMVVTLVEHGVTPSALVARLTYLGAPEAMQAAVAGGLLGLGSVFVGSMEGVAKLCSEAFAGAAPDVAAILSRYKRIPGLGHPLHKPVDPRTVRLFEIARETGFYGRYCRLMEDIAREKKLTLNATGAIGALACELGLDWRCVRGLGVMARAVGLVGHILEEARDPMAEEIWLRVDEEASAHLKPKR